MFCQQTKQLSPGLENFRVTTRKLLWLTGKIGLMCKVRLEHPNGKNFAFGTDKEKERRTLSVVRSDPAFARASVFQGEVENLCGVTEVFLHHRAEGLALKTRAWAVHPLGLVERAEVEAQVQLTLD